MRRIRSRIKRNAGPAMEGNCPEKQTTFLAHKVSVPCEKGPESGGPGGPVFGTLSTRGQPARLVALTTFKLLAPSILLQTVAHVFDIHSHSLPPSPFPLQSDLFGSSSSLTKMDFSRPTPLVVAGGIYMAPCSQRVFALASLVISLSKFRLLLSYQPDLGFKSWKHHHYNPLHVSHRPCWTGPVSLEETVIDVALWSLLRMGPSP